MLPSRSAAAQQRGVVVALGVFAVHHDGNTQKVLKVEEVLLLVAHHHGDVVDAGLLELADLALDKHLAAHLQDAFGLLVGDGAKRLESPAAMMTALSTCRLERREPRIGEAVPIDLPRAASLR